MASVGSVLPGLYWAQILLIAMWFAKFGLQSIGTKPMNNWSSPEMEDLVPELTDDTLLVLEKATTSTKQSNQTAAQLEVDKTLIQLLHLDETFEDGLVPVSPGDPTFGLHFSQSHFESLGSDFEGIVVLDLKNERVINFLPFHYRRFRSNIERRVI